jgi:tetratricopeptide (TPR) repeat protein
MQTVKEGLPAEDRKGVLMESADKPAQTSPFYAAREHYLQGRYDAAYQVLGQALPAQPDNWQLWNLAGVVTKAQGRKDAAEECLRRAIALNPAYVEAHYNLGLLLQEAKRQQEAADAYREVLRLSPQHKRALNNLSDSLMELDQPDAAIRSAEQAIAIDPAYALAYHNLGRAYTQLGRIDEALPLLRKAIELAPPQELERFYRTLAFTKRFVPGDPDLAKMEELAANMAGATPDRRMKLHFGLGKAYGDIGQREQSFTHLLAGNSEMRRQKPYDEAATLEEFARIAAAYTPALMHTRSGAGVRSEVPVFIVGMPRSGSTLAEQILASHPDVHGAGECGDLPALAEAMRIPGDRPLLPDGIAELPDGGLQWLGLGYLQRMTPKAPQARRIVDKNLGSFKHLGLIHLALPGAKIIHTRRDPVDTCLSCFSHLFAGEHPYAYDLAELGRYWRAYDRLMAHWRSVLPPGVLLELQYEDVVEDLEGQARRLVAHCGLEWNEACLSFHKTERVVRTASMTQVRQPIYRGSMQKWRAYGELLRPLLDALGDAVPAARAQDP